MAKQYKIIDPEGNVLTDPRCKQNASPSLSNSSETRRLSSLLKPAPFAAIVGGLCALGAAPATLPGIAAVLVTGVATGYGARWGRFVIARAGLFAGIGVGGALGAGLVDKLARAEMKNKRSSASKEEADRLTGIGGMIGAGGGAAVFWALGSIAGYAAGAMVAYEVVKTPAIDWATDFTGKQYSLVVPMEPTRALDMVQKDGQTYQLVFKNG